MSRGLKVSRPLIDDMIPSIKRQFLVFDLNKILVQSPKAWRRLLYTQEHGLWHAFDIHQQQACLLPGVILRRFLQISQSFIMLLSITVIDTFWRSQLDILLLSIKQSNRGHHEKKKIELKQHFATTFRLLTKKIMVLVDQSTFLVHCTMLA